MIFVHKYFLPAVLVRALQRNRANGLYVCVCVCVCVCVHACVCERELVHMIVETGKYKISGTGQLGTQGCVDVITKD